LTSRNRQEEVGGRRQKKQQAGGMRQERLGRKVHLTGRNRQEEQETNRQQAGDRQSVQGGRQDIDRRQTILYRQKTGGMIDETYGMDRRRQEIDRNEQGEAGD
jgi:hypothetical protein